MKPRVYVSPEQIQKDLAFSDVDLDSAMMEQASLYSHYNTLHAKAVHQADAFKNRLDLVESELDSQIRQHAASREEKITEPMIKSQIRKDARYQEAFKYSNDAKYIANLAKSAVNAFEQRRDMLVQVGKRAMEEHKGQLRLRSANTLNELGKRAASA